VYPDLFLERYVVCMLYKNIAELIPEQDNRLVDFEILPLYNSKWKPKFVHTVRSVPPPPLPSSTWQGLRSFHQGHLERITQW